MRTNTKINIAVFLILVISMAIYYRYDMGRRKKMQEELQTEYPLITITEQVSGVILDIDEPNPNFFRKNPHAALVSLDSKIKKGIMAGDEFTTGISLDSLIRVGDLVVKKQASDTLFLYKIHANDTVKYCFQL